MFLNIFSIFHQLSANEAQMVKDGHRFIHRDVFYLSVLGLWLSVESVIYLYFSPFFALFFAFYALSHYNGLVDFKFIRPGFH